VTAPLARAFYARDALTVARALLGKQLRRGRVVLRITEVEAYRHPDDSASHCRMGKTPRNAPMWGPPGHAYVYLCYGIHQLLNLVCGA
jgi:DNA-3-methyladenine glycosylase